MDDPLSANETLLRQHATDGEMIDPEMIHYAYCINDIHSQRVLLVFIPGRPRSAYWRMVVVIFGGQLTLVAVSF